MTNNISGPSSTEGDGLVEQVARAMRDAPYTENDGSDTVTADAECEINFNALARAAIEVLRSQIERKI